MSAPKPRTDRNLLTDQLVLKDLARRYKLRESSRALVVSRAPGDGVAFLRRCRVTAFGVFDGSAPPRDPFKEIPADEAAPELQPVVLHQSLPFHPLSFDLVLLHDSTVYRQALSSPEACTATANLLACLKPTAPLIFAEELPAAAVRSHLSCFPGSAREITLGTAGVGGLLRRVIGRGVEHSAIEFTVPPNSISRLEWHRIARQAVISSQRQPAA